MSGAKRILVVDDEPLVLEYARRALVGRGYQVDTCDDALRALVRLSRDPFDLVLVDFVMPKLNGFHFVRAVESKLATPPRVVVMSSLTAKISERFSRTTGVRAFLEKPFTVEQLIAVVTANLEAPELDVEVDVEPATTDDDDGMLVAAMREALQVALAEHLPKHAAGIAAASGDELQYAIAILLDDVFTPATTRSLGELVRSFAAHSDEAVSGARRRPQGE